MVDRVHLQANSTENMKRIGHSLVQSLYEPSTDLLLHGELGAGKTTVVQGVMQGLGYAGPVTSPTYALEERYDTPRGQVLHIDCYRLDRQSASALLDETPTALLRCIEWSERADSSVLGDARIQCSIEEQYETRHIHLNFEDIPLPSKDRILAWRKGLHLPLHVAQHCDAVANLAVSLADALLSDGIVVRREALHQAALVHDLFRFVDFHPAATPGSYAKPNAAVLRQWKNHAERYGNNHEIACTKFLEAEGFQSLARIVSTHGLSKPILEFDTVEQKLLFYADKRTLQDRFVSVQERFDDFAVRYGNGKESAAAHAWRVQTQELEDALFPEGAPV